LHPLDDSPAPSRAYEKKLRKTSRQYARSVRDLHGEQVARLAREALKSYKALAQQMGEFYFINRIDRAMEEKNL
jgi:hypothetical protein